MLVTRPLTPGIDLLALHRLAPARYPLLLESSAAGTAQGRWDLLLATSGESLTLSATDNVVRRDDGSGAGTDFLSALDGDWRRQRTPRDEPRWPFRGGWALFLGYELAAQVEPILSLPQARGKLPVAIALRCPAAVLRDRATGETALVAEAAHADMLDTLEADCARAAGLAPLAPWQPPDSVVEDDPADFTDGVRRILDYLAAGDLFQVNLSRACARTIPRHSPGCSPATAGRSSALPPNGWYRCAAMSSKHDRSRARVRAFPVTTTVRACVSWSGTPRNAPSTSCSSTSNATISAACARRAAWKSTN
jgi:anthranilate/para-aminobenzoate synthase component I